MPFVPVANTVEVELRMLLDSQHIENTLYFNMGGAPDPDQMNDLGNALITWWEDQYSTQASTSLELREVVVTSLQSATAPQISVAPAVSAFGDLSSPVLPSNVSLCLSLRTASRGRSFRGRNYFAGLTESQVSGNTVSDPTVDALIDIYDLLRVTPVHDSGEHCVVSRFSGVDPVTHRPIPRVAGINTLVTSVIVVDKTIDSMRRRLPGRGR